LLIRKHGVCLFYNNNSIPFGKIIFVQRKGIIVFSNLFSLGATLVFGGARQYIDIHLLPCTSAEQGFLKEKSVCKSAKQ
jgi:hypothetical protein